MTFDELIGDLKAASGTAVNHWQAPNGDRYSAVYYNGAMHFTCFRGEEVTQEITVAGDQAAILLMTFKRDGFRQIAAQNGVEL